MVHRTLSAVRCRLVSNLSVTSYYAVLPKTVVKERLLGIGNLHQQFWVKVLQNLADGKKLLKDSKNFSWTLQTSEPCFWNSRARLHTTLCSSRLMAMACLWFNSIGEFTDGWYRSILSWFLGQILLWIYNIVYKDEYRFWWLLKCMARIVVSQMKEELQDCTVSRSLIYRMTCSKVFVLFFQNIKTPRVSKWLLGIGYTYNSDLRCVSADFFYRIFIPPGSCFFFYNIAVTSVFNNNNNILFYPMQ